MGVGKGIIGGLGHRNRKGENELKRCRGVGKERGERRGGEKERGI